MQFNFRTLLLLLTLTVISCSKEEETLSTGPVTVTIGSEPRIGIDIETKSTLDPDGVTVNWAKGDKLAVWARNETGEYQFSAQPFVLWQFDATFNHAKFTATIDPMPAGKYDYFALTPVPETVTDTRATYSISMLQTGDYNNDYDIRIATPSRNKAPLTEGDNSSSVSFSFVHKVHMLRIRIPENRLGEPVTELELTFPAPVVGKLTVDATDPDAVPVLTEGHKTLTIRPKKPLNVGDVVTAMIAPTEIPSTEGIEIRAYGETSGSMAVFMPGKNFEAGRTTPIALTIPFKERDYTSIELSLTDLGASTLGENISLFKISGPYDCNLGNGSSERLFDVKKNGEKYIFWLGRKFTPAKDNISGKTFKVTYESPNAILTTSFVMPQLSDGQRNVIPTMTVPYLFEEDFSGVSTFSNSEGTTGINDPDAIWIPGLSGWSAARVGGSAGKSVRIVGHREGGFYVFVDYEARMDSAPLTAIRKGKSVKIKVSFNYSGSTSKGAPKFKYGVSNAQGLISGANASIETQIGSITANTKGSYSNVNQSITPFTATGTPETRLTWVAYGSDGGFAGSYFYYIYLDNIKVSIAK